MYPIMTPTKSSMLIIPIFLVIVKLLVRKAWPKAKTPPWKNIQRNNYPDNTVVTKVVFGYKTPDIIIMQTPKWKFI